MDYGQMVAGIAPAGPNPDQTVSWLAMAALDTMAVHIMHEVADDRAYYMAIPAALAANGPCATPLAVAFAEHPGHKGDGIYQLALPGRTACVLRTAQRFEFVQNLPHAVESWLDEPTQAGLPVYAAEDSAPWTFRATRVRKYLLAQGAMSRMARWNFVGAAAAIALSLCLALATGTLGWWQAKRSSQSESHSVRAATSVIDGSFAYQATLSDFQRLAAVAARAGGWIDAYRVKQGIKPEYILGMPLWISNDYLADLPGARTERDTENGVIVVRGGDWSDKW